MAVSAAEASLASSRGSWWQLLTPTPGRLEFALRLALICALTVLVTETYQTPEPALTAYIVFFLNRDNRATSVIINFALCVVATIVVALLVLLARQVADDPMWRVISIALISFGLLFLTSASKLRPVGGTLALIAGFALDLLGMLQAGEEATRGLLYAWLFVGIPAGLSLVVNLILAPAPRRLAEQAIARRLRLCARLLRKPDEAACQALRQYLDEGIGSILDHLRVAGIEGANQVRDLEALRQATASCWALLSAVEALGSSPAATLPQEWREIAARTLEEMAGLLMAGKYPLEVTLERAPAVGPLASQVAAQIREAIIRFAQGAAPAVAAPRKQEGFFVRDAFTNPDHARYALRTTAAALFCYTLYTVLDWPGIHTCFLTCYIVSQSTAAESIEKLSLRIVGCLIGSAAGIGAIVYLMPYLTSVEGLIGTVFLGTSAAAYIAAGSPRISYAGFQIAFAFLLCILQGTGPTLDLVVARDRIIGILIGNLVAYLALTRLWPVPVSSRVDPGIASLLRRLSRLMSARDSHERRMLSSEVRTGLAAVETDIRLAAYEPRLLRPSAGWLAARRAAVHETGPLTGLLLIGCEQGVGLADIAGRLRGLAERLEAGVAARPGGTRVAGPSSLQTLVDSHLYQLEEAFSGAHEKGELSAPV
jgi:multidrug resistance protein MdtO